MVEPRNFGYYMIDDIVSYYAWVMKFEISETKGRARHTPPTPEISEAGQASHPSPQVPASLEAPPSDSGNLERQKTLQYVAYWQQFRKPFPRPTPRPAPPRPISNPSHSSTVKTYEEYWQRFKKPRQLAEASPAGGQLSPTPLVVPPSAEVAPTPSPRRLDLEGTRLMTDSLNGRKRDQTKSWCDPFCVLSAFFGGACFLSAWQLFGTPRNCFSSCLGRCQPSDRTKAPSARTLALWFKASSNVCWELGPLSLRPIMRRSTSLMSDGSGEVNMERLTEGGGRTKRAQALVNLNRFLLS